MGVRVPPCAPVHSLEPFFEEALGHERRHRDAFAAMMPARQARPCALLWLWSLGGFLLGALTSLLGRRGAMVCTAGVERTVHAHLEDQLAYLRARDPALAQLIEEIRVEELAHLAFAEDRMGEADRFSRLVFAFVAMGAEAVIWLATRGDSLRLRRALAEHASVQARRLARRGLA